MATVVGVSVHGGVVGGLDKDGSASPAVCPLGYLSPVAMDTVVVVALVVVQSGVSTPFGLYPCVL